MTGACFSLSGKSIWVAGHRGMVGQAILRRLKSEDCHILTAARDQLDLTDKVAVDRWLKRNVPDAIIVAAAKVGGIRANSDQPADFLFENLAIAANVIGGAHAANIQRLLFVGSSAVYPKMAPQPMDEDMLLSGPLEPSHEGYAVAKIAGLKMCQMLRRQYGRRYIAAVPTNLYGPGDNFDLHGGHVVPALIRKAHEAKASGAASLTIWGSGTPRREFLHADDCADGLVHLLKHYDDEQQVNLGSGTDIPIRELAEIIAQVVGFNGEIMTDPSKPDGPPRKLMNADKMRKLSWEPKIPLESGLAETYQHFLETID